MTVRVLQQLHQLPDDHPDIRTVKHAASHMYKALKRERRTRKREAELAADRAVTALTATGSPAAHRRRDAGPRAGLVRARARSPAS